jgi:cytochrome c-type biogenesis protein CcmH
VASVSGIVSLAPSLAATVAPNDTVFIFARAAEGPRMPLAILRHRASELPIRFTLDDSQAMSPEMKMSKFPRVVVGARVSKSGNAMTQPGDLIAAPVPGGGSELKLVIDQVQP